MAKKSTHFWDMLNEANQAHAAPVSVSSLNMPKRMFSGAGADGIVQPNKPAFIDRSSGTPAIVHEGEMITNHPSGGKQVTSNRDLMRGVTPLTTERQQRIVANVERNQNSFRGGGIIDSYRHGGVMHSYRGGGMIPSYQQGGEISRETNPLAPPQQDQSFGALPTANAPVGVVPTAEQTQVTAGVQAGFGQPQQAPQQAPQAQAIPSPVGLEPPKPQSELPFGKRDATPENLELAKSGDKQFKTVDDFKKDQNKTLQKLIDLSDGNSELYDRLRETYLGQTGAIQAAKQSASQQRSLQEGLSPEMARLVDQQQQREFSAERGNLMNQLAEQEAAAAINATSQAHQATVMATQQKVLDTKNKIEELKKQGGTENLNKAEELLMELYGTQIDLDRFKTQQTLGDIAKFVSMGLGVEDTIGFAIKSGMMDKFALTETQLRDMITPMVMAGNPLVAATTMAQDWVAQGIMTQQQASDYIAMTQWAMTHPDGLEMFNSFVVTDANGNEVGNFKSEDEADAFITNNGGKNYKKTFKKNGYIGLKGSYEEYFGTKQPGDIFKGKGGALFAIVDGRQVPAKMTPLMPFSSMNNSLYKYYKQNGLDDKANEVLNLQIDHLRTLADVDGFIDVLPAGVTKDHPAYIAWNGKEDESSGGGGSVSGTTTTTTSGSDVGETAGEGGSTQETAPVQVEAPIEINV